MFEIALLLLACVVFAALTVVAVAAALKATRVEDVIGEVFSPWFQDPFGSSGGLEIGEPTSRDEDDVSPQHPRASEAIPEERRVVAGRT